MNKIRSFDEAYKFLVTTVPKTSASTFKGITGFQKSQLWMKMLGNSQNKYPTIHIAGTSGKGTVSHLISAILETHGKRTALLVSPHAYDIRERILIGRQMLSKKVFTDSLNSLLPSYRKMKKMGSSPSYFEMLFALGFSAALRSKIDYCVVETGVGGKLDTSNTIDRKDKLCVITPIGFDHMNVLGNTLKEIASQKIGIVHPQQQVFSAPQTKEAMKAIKDGCHKVDAKLTVVSTQTTLKKYGISNLPKLNNQLYGAHNRLNLALAIKSVEHIASRDGWFIKPALIRTAIKTLYIPGRFEIVRTREKREFVFDGAHNEQKLSALMDAVKERYGNKKVGFVFASSKDDPKNKLNIIVKRAEVIILTKYHSKELDMVRPQPDLEKFADNKKLFYLPKTKDVISYINSSDVSVWVITGSFYILGGIKNLIK